MGSWDIEPGYPDSDAFIQQYEATNKYFGHLVATEPDVPQVVLTTPLANTKLVNSQPVFAVASTGGTGHISEVGFFIDNVLQGQAQQAPPYTMTLNTSGLAKGPHTVGVCASTSANGKWQSCQSVSVTK